MVILAPNPAAIASAADVLSAGGLVGLPTETVYGLAADAANPAAVAAIFAAKGRPRFNPLIIHVSTAEQARALGDFSAQAEALAARFWPGPLTLVTPYRGAAVCDLARAGLETVAVRAPSHPVARALLEAYSRPVAAPSANRSGRISPTQAQHVAEEFPELETILDGGAAACGLESTIVACMAGRPPALLRPGAVSREEIEAVIGPLAEPGEAILAPGMTLRHYAPRARLRLDVKAAEPGEAFVGFGATGAGPFSLSTTGDLREAAAKLYALLRSLDEAGWERIAVAPIPEYGLGEAINDRLRRAASAQQESGP